MRFACGTWSTLCGFLVVLGYCRAARAEEPAHPQFGFDYVAEPELGCPGAGEIRSAVARQLGYDPFVSDGATPGNSVHLLLTKAGSGLEARIDWVDQKGESEGGRRLASEAGDCAELARGVVFAVAVQIQLRASTTPVVAKPPPATPAPVAPARPPRPVLRASTPPSRLFLVGLGVGVERGWSPKTAAGFRLVSAVGIGRALLEVGVGATLPTTYEQHDGTSFEARTLNAWLSPCIRTPPLSWCATGMVGRLSVEGQGVDHPLSTASTLAAAGGKIELLWPVFRNLGVLVDAQALATLTARDVMLNRATAWSTPPIYYGAGGALAFIFK